MLEVRLERLLKVIVKFVLRAGGPGSIPGFGGMEIFSSLLRDQTGLKVHSASYKMCTGALPEVKAAERRTSHPTSSYCDVYS